MFIFHISHKLQGSPQGNSPTFAIVEGKDTLTRKDPHEDRESKENRVVCPVRKAEGMCGSGAIILDAAKLVPAKLLKLS